MNHITKEEYLSAFYDGEAGSFEENNISDQLSNDDIMRDKLSKYALIGEAMRDRSLTGEITASPSFLAGIQSAIAQEEVVPAADVKADDANVVSFEAAKAKKKHGLPRQALGYAIAASVAAVAAISFQNYTQTAPQKEELLADNSMNAAVEETHKINTALSSSVRASTSQKKAVANDYFVKASFKTPDARTKDLMDKYVAHHLQYASSSTLMPRVRAVSYSTDF